MKTLLKLIADRLPCRIISDGQRPYLERYYLATLFGVRFYLHRFVGSDPDRGLHDHPWPWAVSFILSGWYIEETRAHPLGRQVHWFNCLVGDSFHRVVMPEFYRHDWPSEVWTLFAHRAADVKPWGFLNPAEPYGFWEGEQLWTQFRYGGGKDKQWWKSAPRGRDCGGRQP